MEQAIEETKPLMQLVFYCMDKVKRYKLSREAKNKADKNRTKVSFIKGRGKMKSSHSMSQNHHSISGCRESLEVNPRCEGREGGRGEGEEEEGVEGADQGDRGPGEAEEDGGAREQEGEEEGSA